MSASIDNPHFLLRRLHSLLGLLPVGAFLIFHLWENSQSRLGAEHYNREVAAALQGMNYLPFLEILLIALPLLFHAVYGLVIVRQGRPVLGATPMPVTGSTGCSGSPGWASSPFCSSTSG